MRWLTGRRKARGNNFFLTRGGLFALAAFTVLLSAAATGAGDSSPPLEALQPESTDLDYAQVLFVEAVRSEDGRWCIYATVRHNDEGWEHYANAWQVLDGQGEELAWRLLAHPHDDEQPFTRDKCGVTIPPEVTELMVRAKCKVHGFGGQSVTVDLKAEEGEKFKVLRIR
jgi:hypothetical protein